jgi:hypothetical protein
MTRKPTPPRDHNWDIYRLTGTPAKFVGRVRAPTMEAAIKTALEEFKIDPRFQSRLIAQRRD